LVAVFDFLVCFSFHFSSAGVGLMWKNVLGTVNKAFDINVQSSMVITWSIVNTLARLLIGVLSDVFAHRGVAKGIRVPVVFSVLFFSFSFSLLVSVWIGSLFASSREFSSL
jgi:hypothetical protein